MIVKKKTPDCEFDFAEDLSQVPSFICRGPINEMTVVSFNTTEL